jgi:hypothetical protein
VACRGQALRPHEKKSRQRSLHVTCDEIIAEEKSEKRFFLLESNLVEVLTHHEAVMESQQDRAPLHETIQQSSEERFPRES